MRGSTVVLSWSRLVVKTLLALMSEAKLQHLEWTGDDAQNGSHLAAPPLPTTYTLDIHTASCHVTPSLIDSNKPFAPD